MKTSHIEIFQRLIHGAEYNPHHLLGLHDTQEGKEIRLWRPGAQTVYLEAFGKIVEAKRVHDAGVFIYPVPKETTVYDYRIYHQNGLFGNDPYAFLPTLGEVDQYLFGRGVHYEIYKVMGAHVIRHQGVPGTKFAVWAPGAKSVSLVGDFNYWDGRVNPMRSLGKSGIWELFIPGLGEGDRYKFEIKTQANTLRVKSDPFGNYSEVRPATASIIFDTQRFQWNDQRWMDARAQRGESYGPLNIYEVHLGSWRQHEGRFLNYRELGKQLVDYCLEMGFTHLELMPVQEHPYDESWGYQVTGYYAATSRFGTPEDFQWFVNHCHEHQIGVILDWVPGHFPTDDFSLARFDGTSLYEHEDPRQGFHPHWNTSIFNCGRHEVANFLLGSALFWFEQMHVDGLRVDAVASMLYLDYGRENGEWVPNAYGGKENLESIEFLKHLNSIVHQRNPGILMIAEESTSFLGVTHPVQKGGLGFDLKWNMGWMNDTLRYFSTDMLFRNYHQNDLTFGLLYAFSERFILVLSHDEVVHEKKSLMGKMPGDMWQQFANMRLLYAYMICQPGKKLIFMGGEIGQWNEWSCHRGVEWDLLRFPIHHGLQTMIKELNHFYLHNPCLWEKDFDFSGFAWVDFADQHNSVISYLRKSSREYLLCVHNFTPMYHHDYIIRMDNVSFIHEVFNTDLEKYGGSGKTNPQCEILYGDGHAWGIKLHIAPLATMIFKIGFY